VLKNLNRGELKLSGMTKYLVEGMPLIAEPCLGYMCITTVDIKLWQFLWWSLLMNNDLLIIFLYPIRYKI
jgi:hypothetical protein